MKEIDCRGLACPQPVLNTKDALEAMASGRITVIVDNEAAEGNVTRFARSQGCEVSAEKDGSNVVLTINKTGPATGPEPEIVCDVAGPAPGKPKLVVKVSDKYMGSGSEELGRILMTAFLKSLREATVKPDSVVFYNSGIFLTCRESDSLEALVELEKSGVQIFSCGTCLDFFNKKEELAVGKVTNMFEIIETLSAADRVVSP